MHDTQDNAAQIAFWNDKAAVTWTALQERLDSFFGPVATLALEAAAPVAGEGVIDVGCGCGATVLALADRIGATGHVLGLDVSEPMSARARERIAAARIGNAQIIVADASNHVFSQTGADLLFSRFGVMFFADPIAAFANLRRGMRRDGRLLCAVWRALADNSWSNVPLEAARPFLPPQPPADLDSPGPFAFANPDRTLGILARAGWHDAKMTSHDVPMRFAATGQLEQATEFATRIGMLARVLAEQQPAVHACAREAVTEALKPYDSAEGIVLPGSIWLISARA